MRYQNANLSDSTMHLDGNEYVGCTFHRSTLVIHADGKPYIVTGCQFLHPYRLAFADGARRTLLALVRVRRESPARARTVEKLFDRIIKGKGDPSDTLRAIDPDLLRSREACETIRFLWEWARSGKCGRQTVETLRADVRAGDFLAA